MRVHSLAIHWCFGTAWRPAASSSCVLRSQLMCACLSVSPPAGVPGPPAAGGQHPQGAGALCCAVLCCAALPCIVAAVSQQTV